MDSLFGRLVKFKKENSNKENYKYAEDVLIKLLTVSSNNSDSNTLPNIFCIDDIHYTADELQNLMKELGYECIVRLITENEDDDTSCFFVSII